MSAPATTTTGAVMRRYLEALTTGDLDTIADSFAEDATWWIHGDLPVSGTHRGRGAIVRFLLDAVELFVPGTQRFELGELMTAGDRAALEWRVVGTAAATGAEYDNRYAGIFVVRDHRIAEVREYLDSRHAGQVLWPAP